MNFKNSKFIRISIAHAQNLTGPPGRYHLACLLRMYRMREHARAGIFSVSHIFHRLSQDGIAVSFHSLWAPSDKGQNVRFFCACLAN